MPSLPFRTKFDKDMQSMKGRLGIGCISDYEPQPLMVRSHHGTYAITTVSKINNTDELVQEIFSNGNSHFLEMSGGEINPTELVATLINQKENLIDGINYALGSAALPVPLLASYRTDPHFPRKYDPESSAVPQAHCPRYRYRV